MDDIQSTVYFRRRDDGTIEFKTVLKFDATMEQALAISLEYDLASQWAPFNPTYSFQLSKNTAALMNHSILKIPLIPGSRESYCYRLVVDCFTPMSEPVVGKDRQGLLFIDRAPSVWKTGGQFKNEFHIPPPSKGWTSRDEQRLFVSFWEPLSETSAQATIYGEVVLNISKWLLPDSTVLFLVKQITRAANKGLTSVFRDFEKYGYIERIKHPNSCPMYQSVAATSKAYLSTLQQRGGSQRAPLASVEKKPSGASNVEKKTSGSKGDERRTSRNRWPSFIGKQPTK
jgi:hypothetical protein